MCGGTLHAYGFGAHLHLLRPIPSALAHKGALAPTDGLPGTGSPRRSLITDSTADEIPGKTHTRTHTKRLRSFVCFYFRIVMISTSVRCDSGPKGFREGPFRVSRA